MLGAALTTTTNQAKAWDGGLGNCGFGCGYHHNWGGGGCENGNGCGDNGGGIGNLLGGFQNLWSGCGYGCGNGGGGYYNVGYQEGTQDAIYDHQNNLAYSDQPSCISCHSQVYLDGFKHAYDQQWNSYQVQNTEQKTVVNINGNNNYVNIGQKTNQEQEQHGPSSEGGSCCNEGPSGCGFGCNGGP